ncbi:MAG: hypothetical protein D8M58_20805 [Calditrichaeota bacterium]|nr:MAG: hypothetical protein DWQ03_01135 [Calditrichota bacterium]MBL1207852.1 hypothetical protein [Calditrichota bacterium]NOG47686.1 hypothetical protein [Calditrichota bacterium]
MSNHLSKDELEQIIQKTPQHLSTNRFLHYEKCSYCQGMYKDQNSIHVKLLKLNPLTAPGNILDNVVNAVTKMSPKTIKVKTDWLFLFALMALFGIGIWFVFNSSFTNEFSQLFTKIISDSETTFKMPPIINNVKENVKGIDLSFDVFKVNGHGLYLAFGFLSIILYVILDNRFGRIYKIK